MGFLSQNNNRLLMVCYYYPPLMDTGSKRSVAFAENLKKHGWQPYVLTVKNPDKTYCIVGNFPQPSGIYTEKALSVFNPYRLLGRMNGLMKRLLWLFGIKLDRNIFHDIFCIPDIFVGWIPFAVLKGYRLIKRKKIHLIYVSCTPFSSALIGIFLKKLTKKPLLVDFRDPYALETLFFREYSFLPRFRKVIDTSIERMIMKGSDLFVIVTDELRDAYISKYPEYSNKIRTIHNGFDDRILAELKRLPKFDRFTIIYAGNYYFGDLEPSTFFEALFLLKKSGHINNHAFQFLYYGSRAETIARLARDHGVEDLTQVHSQVPYPKMLETISRSHLLYVRALGGAFPTKIPDGLALNVPLLADLPPGEARKIVRRFSPGSYIITGNSPEKTAEAIADAMENNREGDLPDNDVKGFLAEFSRENLTLKLMSFLEEASLGVSKNTL